MYHRSQCHSHLSATYPKLDLLDPKNDDVLAAWTELFEHWQECDLMNRISDEAVPAAYAKR